MNIQSVVEMELSLRSPIEYLDQHTARHVIGVNRMSWPVVISMIDA